MKLGSAWLFDVGAAVYSGMNAQRAWLRSCEQLAAHFPPDVTSPRVLDLGCGPGFSAVALARIRPDATLVGLDLAPRMLAEARRYVPRSGVGGRVRLIQADAARLPIGDQAFEVVTGHSFLYLVDRPTQVLAEVRRVLRPGGRLVLMEPSANPPGPGAVLRHSLDPRFLFSVALWRPYSRRHGRFSPATLEATLATAGLKQFGCEPVLAGLGLIGWATRS